MKEFLKSFFNSPENDQSMKRLLAFIGTLALVIGYYLNLHVDPIYIETIKDIVFVCITGVVVEKVAGLMNKVAPTPTESDTPDA